MIHNQSFEWNQFKNKLNQFKHGISFEEAQLAFLDADRLVFEDILHSKEELRYFCIGKVGVRIVTVRFTLRGSTIRIIGAGYWRKYKRLYNERNTHE